MNIRSIVAATALALASIPAAAAAPNNASDLPPLMTQGAVRYMSGGIGSDEADAMRAEAARYPLTLEFAARATPKDLYLAAINVGIVDQSGRTTLETISDGPLMLLQLPAGTYRITVEHDGRTQTRDVTIAANKPERLFFEW